MTSLTPPPLPWHWLCACTSCLTSWTPSCCRPPPSPRACPPLSTPRHSPSPSARQACCCCCWSRESDSNMILFDIQAMLRKSSSNFFHISLDSVNMASLTLSKSSQLFLKNGSSKKKSLMVTGTLDPDIVSGIFVLTCLCDIHLCFLFRMGC